MARVRYNVGLQRQSQVSGHDQVGRVGGEVLAIFVVDQPRWMVVNEMEVEAVFGGGERIV